MQNSTNLKQTHTHTHTHTPPETYNSLINTFAKSGKYKEAVQMVKEMQRTGVPRDIITWNSVMDAVANEAAMGRLSGAQCGREVMQVSF